MVHPFPLDSSSVPRRQRPSKVTAGTKSSHVCSSGVGDKVSYHLPDQPITDLNVHVCSIWLEKSIAPTHIHRAVFGVTLEEALDVSQIAGLPAIVFRSIEYLESMKADQEEGIYRLSGSSAVIKNLKDKFNAGM